MSVTKPNHHSFLFSKPFSVNLSLPNIYTFRIHETIKDHHKMPTNNSNPGNFANRPKEEVRAIASKGGRSGTENKGFASEKYDDEKQVSHTWGHSILTSPLPSRLPLSRALYPAVVSSGYPRYAVFLSPYPSAIYTPERTREADHEFTIVQREAASKGGKASSGSFQPGDERAREAGRKGGKVSNRSNASFGTAAAADGEELA